MKDDKAQQIAITERLQLKWLIRMEKLLDDGDITPTDMANLSRVLLANGWNIDPSRLPKGLRDKLEEHISPADLDDEENEYIAGTIGSSKSTRKSKRA